jgi:hypothetical protein
MPIEAKRERLYELQQLIDARIVPVNGETWWERCMRLGSAAALEFELRRVLSTPADLDGTGKPL